MRLNNEPPIGYVAIFVDGSLRRRLLGGVLVVPGREADAPRAARAGRDRRAAVSLTRYAQGPLILHQRAVVVQAQVDPTFYFLG